MKTPVIRLLEYVIRREQRILEHSDTIDPKALGLLVDDFEELDEIAEYMTDVQLFDLWLNVETLIRQHWKETDRLQLTVELGAEPFHPDHPYQLTEERSDDGTLYLNFIHE
jgi:hypothetical protein